MAASPSEHPTALIEQAADRTRVESATPTFTAAEPGQAPLLRDGERIAGRYLVEGVLGRGGFGEVYRVRDEQRGGERLALKLHRLGASNRHARQALAAEFELLGQLAHPNLARVYDFGHVDELAAYFTEAIAPGVRLDRSGLRPDDPAAMPFFSQLCRALDYLHSRGILHRDLKPSNVLADTSLGMLTLLDFGVARMFGLSESMRIIGTFAYIAPEAIAGGPVDARADLYALGVTLYQLVAGHVPFRGSSSAVLEAHVLVEPPPLDRSRVAPAVADVIERLLRKEPGERHASAGEVLDALSRANGVAVPEEPRDELSSYVLSARFVGKADSVLDGLVRRALSGAAFGVAVVAGEAGSGKSRLLREARQRVQLAGRTWVEAAHKGTADRSLLLDIARAVITPLLAERLDEDDRLSLARALPELRKRGERMADPVDPERERDARYRALARAVAQRFVHAPGVLAIEDLHWATEETHELLARLVAHLRDEGAECLLVATTRPGPEGRSLAEALSADVLSCPPLEAADSARLVESMFGEPDLLAGTELGAVLTRERHPALYVQESLRLALETGAIARRAGRWIVQGKVPALPLGAVLEARVRHLSPASRRLALAVSVLGGRGTGAEIAGVSGQPLRRSGDAFGQLVRAGLLEEERDTEGAATYVMHDRFIDVVLSLAGPDEQRAAHRRAGRVLRRVAKTDWRTLMPAADHFAQAGELERAIALCVQAATAALAHGHPQMALSAAEREIAMRRATGETVPVEVVLRRFDVAMRAGEGLNDALESVVAARGEASPVQRIEIDLREARAYARRGELARARPICDRALEAARALGERRLEGEIVLVCAAMDEEGGEIRRSMDRFVAAAELALSRDSSTDEARARVGATLAALRLGDPATAHAMATRALEVLHAKEEPLLRSEALRAIGNVRRERGDVAGSARAYRKAVRAAREAGSSEAEAKALNNLGTVAQWAGRVGEAEAALLRAIRLKQRIGTKSSSLLSEINLGSLLLCTARLDEAYARLAPFAEMTEGPAVVLTLAQSNLGDVLTSIGRYDEAIRYYGRAWQTSSSAAMVQQASHAGCGLVRALIMRSGEGDVARARDVLAEFERMHAGSGLIESVRRFHSAAAMLADLDGDVARALAHAHGARSSEEEQRLCFTDVFGTTIEVRWMDAILTARGKSDKGGRRKAELTRRALLRLASHIGDEKLRARFLEGLPVHRAIVRLDLDVPRGWTYRPDDVRPATTR